MVRLGIFLLSRRWGLIIVGAALLIGGLIWGMTSHQVSYTQLNNVTVDEYKVRTGTSSGNLYVNKEGSNEFYVAFHSDFSISDNDLGNTAALSFVARTDESSLDPPLDADGTTINNAHKIEKLVLLDEHGSVINTFMAAEYNASPNGFSDNEWMKAIWLILAGLIIGGAALLVPLFTKKPQVSTSFNIGGAGAVQPYQQPAPYGQPNQQQPANPYGQPYQGPGQYPQGQGNPYAPQPPTYGQPNNPYPPQQ